MKLQADETSIVFSNAVTSGFQFNSNGITLLPGKHDFDLNLTAKEPPENCGHRPSFDAEGFRSCLRDYYKEREKNNAWTNNCDCYDYVTLHKICDQPVYDVLCVVTFPVQPGREYQINAYKTREGASVTALEQGSAGQLSSGKCKTLGARVETFEEYLGRGGSDARSYGGEFCSGANYW